MSEETSRALNDTELAKEARQARVRNEKDEAEMNEEATTIYTSNILHMPKIIKKAKHRGGAA